MRSSYHLIRKLAQGGMAEIFLATEKDISDGLRLWCVKRILPNFAQDEEYIKMFMDEYNLIRLFSHPNLVSVRDSVVIDDIPAIVMEFVPGTDIKNILVACEKLKKRIPIPIACFLLREILQGLDYVHNIQDSQNRRLGVIHRDISPQNILISFHGDVKIIDFGVADHATKINQTQVGTLKGKFAYMSPEQIMMKPVDIRTDVFASGVVFWEMLAMKKLFVGSSDVEMIQNVQNCKIHTDLKQLNDGVCDELYSIVMRALHRESKKRYDSCREFSQIISGFLQKKYPEFEKKEFVKFLRELMPNKYQSLINELQQIKQQAQNPSRDTSNTIHMPTFAAVHDNTGSSDEMFESRPVDTADGGTAVANPLGDYVLAVEDSSVMYQQGMEPANQRIESYHNSMEIDPKQHPTVSQSPSNFASFNPTSSPSMHQVYRSGSPRNVSDTRSVRSLSISKSLLMGVFGTAILVACVLFFFFHQEQYFSINSVAKQGIVIKSYPDTVRIFVNNRKITQDYIKTPYAIDSLLFTKPMNTIEIRREGFSSRFYQLDSRKKQASEVDIALQPKINLTSMKLQLANPSSLSSLKYMFQDRISYGTIHQGNVVVVEHLMPASRYNIRFEGLAISFSCELNTAYNPKRVFAYVISPQNSDCHIL